MYVKEWRFNESEEMDDTDDDERGRDNLRQFCWDDSQKMWFSFHVSTVETNDRKSILLLLGSRSNNNNSTNFRDDDLSSLSFFLSKMDTVIQ